MKRNLRTAARAVAVLLGAVLLGCAAPPGGPTGRQQDSVGAAAPEHRAMLSNPNSRGIVRLEPVEGKLNRLLDRLMEHADPAQRARAGRMHVYISATDDVGADCFSDGSIYVRWRTFEFLKTEDALAALLAHEASHLLLGHVSDDGWSALLKPLAAVATLASAGAPGALLTSVFGGQYVERAGLAAWSRNQEIAADTLGIKLLAKAGYKADAFFDVLDSIGQYRLPAEPPGLLSNFKPTGVAGQYQIDVGNLNFGAAESTHPELPQRRANAKAMMDAQGFSDALTPHPASEPADVAGLLANARAAMEGLDAQAQGSRQFRAGDLASATRNLQIALESPVAASTSVQMLRIDIVHRALPARAFAFYLTPLAVRADAPIWLSIFQLNITTSVQDWQTATAIADFVQDRYLPLPVLYPTLKKAYEKRKQQLATALSKNGNIPMPTPGREAEWKEYSRLADLTLKLTLRCVATGDLNIMAGCTQAAR